MRRIISLAVVALGFFAGNLLQAQVRIPGAIHSNESCCAIGMRGPSVPSGSRTTFAVTGIPQRQFHQDGFRNDGFRRDGFRNDGLRRDGFRHDGFRHDRFRNRNGGFGFGGVPIYYNPYGYDTETTEEAQPAANNYEQPVDDEVPGMTVFERRRNYQLIGDSPQYQRGYADAREDTARAENEQAEAKAEREKAPAAPPQEVISTILIFRDGSHREVRNYALMGSSIYDLSVKPGQGKMKILLADLDIPATIAANDQRGIDFRVPNTK